jgi:group I intron endonuclease
MDKKIEKDNGYIYCITNLANDKQYIGATTKTVEKRFKKHLKDAKCDLEYGCSAIKKAIQEFGEDNFDVETILTCNKDELDFYENKYIELYNTLHPNGYNLKTGGNLGSKYCEDSKKKIGESQKGKIISEETKILIGKTSKYRNMDETHKNKIKDALSKLDLVDLPMYIVYSIDKREGRNVEVIKVRVPNTKTRKFASKYMLLEDKIKLAIEYKNSLYKKELKV